jgi:type I restriction enzyme S subunit
LQKIQIPLPSLPTQKQIIQKLDKLSELISLRKESIKKQEDLTKSIFIEMF